MTNNRKILLAYGEPLVDQGEIHKYLGTLENTKEYSENLSGTYGVHVDVKSNVATAFKIIQDVPAKQ